MNILRLSKLNTFGSLSIFSFLPFIGLNQPASSRYVGDCRVFACVVELHFKVTQNSVRALASIHLDCKKSEKAACLSAAIYLNRSRRIWDASCRIGYDIAAPYVVPIFFLLAGPTCDAAYQHCYYFNRIVI